MNLKCKHLTSLDKLSLTLEVVKNILFDMRANIPYAALLYMIV